MPSVEITCVEPDCVQAISVAVAEEGNEQEAQACPNCGREYYPGWLNDDPEVFVDEERDQSDRWKFASLNNAEESREFFEENEYDASEHGQQ